jgi:hypothetical protein
MLQFQCHMSQLRPIQPYIYLFTRRLVLHAPARVIREDVDLWDAPRSHSLLPFPSVLGGVRCVLS